MTLKDRIVTLERVNGTDGQIRELYEILIKRTHNISNTKLPSFKEHVKFVKNHPYRIWYLITANSDCIGSAYIMEDNCVGINLIKNFDFFQNVVKTILKKHKPLKEIKSVRPPYFYINVAVSNKEVEAELIKVQAKKIQSTFILKST